MIREIREITEFAPKRYGWQSTDSVAAHKYIFPKVLSLLPGGNLTIMDVGCGNGYMAGKLAAMGHNVIGVDTAEDGITIAQRKYTDVRFYCRSVYYDLVEICNSVDLVLASEVIEHLYWPNKFLANIHKVLKKGGYVILTTPYHGYLKNLAISVLNCWDKHHTVDWEGGHIKFFSEKSLRRVLRDCGFSEIQFNNAGRTMYFWKSMVCRAIKS